MLNLKWMGIGAPPLFIYFHILGHLSGLELPLTPVPWWDPPAQEFCKSGKYRFTLISPTHGLHNIIQLGLHVGWGSGVSKILLGITFCFFSQQSIVLVDSS